MLKAEEYRNEWLDDHEDDFKITSQDYPDLDGQEIAELNKQLKEGEFSDDVLRRAQDWSYEKGRMLNAEVMESVLFDQDH